MKKNLFLLLFCILLFSACNKKVEEKFNNQNIDKKYVQRWTIPDTESELKIKEDGTYLYGHPMWDGPFAFGKCLMKDGKLKVLYPDSIDINENNDSYKKHDLEVLFQNKDSIFLEYDSEYLDFNTIGCLRREDMIITTFYGEESPANKIFRKHEIKG